MRPSSSLFVNVKQQPGTDLTYGTVTGAPRSNKTFVWSLPVFGKQILPKSQVPGAQLNVNAARAITWFVGVTIYWTFFNNNSPPSRQFLCKKYLWKKLATVTRMLIEQNFELKESGPLGCICTPITGCFRDKKIISKENIRQDCYLLLKYCCRQCTLFPLPGPNHLQNLTPKCKILNVLWT